MFRFFFFQCNLSVMQQSFVIPRDRGTPNTCNLLWSAAVPLITFYGGRREVFVTSAANLSCLSSRCSCPFSHICKSIYILYLILMLVEEAKPSHPSHTESISVPLIHFPSFETNGKFCSTK